MDIEINIFEGFDGVAGGDVVLVEEAVSAVAGGPDAECRGALVAGVNDDGAVLIERD